MDLIQKDLVVGRVYRGKKPSRTGTLGDFVNDRQIVWLGVTQLQYDSAAVRDGRDYPVMKIGKFLDWAGIDVTDIAPDGDWCRWEDYVNSKKKAKSE